jgi:uncharacterized protein YggE
MRPLVLALSLVCISAAAATAQSPAPEGPVVVTTGEGVVKRAPDRAWLTIAAESRAKTAREAQKLNVDAMSGVLAKLKAAGLPQDAIKTTGYNLHPEFDYANNKQTLRGYLARNSVEVRVDDLPKLGELLESVVDAGATNVSGVRFDVKDRDGAEREALRMAVADAQARANAAAAGASMKVERVVKIEEHRSVSVPQPRMAVMRESAMMASGQPPIEAGEIEIRVAVTLTAAIR